MVTQVETDIQQVWHAYRETGNVEYRNRLVERFLPLVKYNAERIWARLPDGVELDRFMGATCLWLSCGRERRQATRCSGAAALPLE